MLDLDYRYTYFNEYMDMFRTKKVDFWVADWYAIESEHFEPSSYRYNQPAKAEELRHSTMLEF